MTAAVSVGAGVAVGGVIAASHLPALQADAQVQPLSPGGQALLAALDRVWKPSDPNVIEVAAGAHLPTQPRRSAQGESPETSRPDTPCSRTRGIAGLFDQCPRRESNLDLPLRRRSSYPLDYEGAGPRHCRARREGYWRSSPAAGAPPASASRASPSPSRRCVIHSPIVCAPMTPVEAERELVPVERRPFQPLRRRVRARARRPPPAAPCRRPRGGGRDARTDPRATLPHWRGSSRRSGRTGRSRAPPGAGVSRALGYQRLRRGTCAEQRLAQLLRGGTQLVLEVLVPGQLTEQLSSTGTSPRSAARTIASATIRALGVDLVDRAQRRI